MHLFHEQPVSQQLAEDGLNLQAVFNVSELPDSMQTVLAEAVENMDVFSQLILLGHGGTRLWECVGQSGIKSDHPVDNYTTLTVDRFFKRHHPDVDYRILFPGDRLIPLQQIGALAGWHFTSPFMVGVNHYWGSWYAYRSVVLAATSFDTTGSSHYTSACDTCREKVCISACPAGATSEGGLDLNKCTQYRKQSDSKCQNQCLARLACPVGREHQYTHQQIHYHYQRSLETIKKYY